MQIKIYQIFANAINRQTSFAAFAYSIFVPRVTLYNIRITVSREGINFAEPKKGQKRRNKMFIGDSL